MDYDVTIIGGGVGGLSTGAVLAKKGLKVLLIESHDKVGGYASCFHRKKYYFDSSIHTIPGDFPDSTFSDFYKLFDIENNIDFIKIPDFYNCYFENDNFVMPDNIEKATFELIVKFPKEKNGIELFFKTMLDIHHHFSHFIRRRPFISATSPFFNAFFSEHSQYWNLSVGTFLDGIISDQKLKVFLLANLAFYHDRPHEMSLVHYMIAQVHYFLGGTYYLKGGSQSFADFLKKYIEERNGKVLLKHTVVKMIVNNNIVNEVHYKKNSLDDKNELLKVSSKIVVANAPMPIVYDNLIEDYPEKELTREQLKKYGLSITGKFIYFGLKKSLCDLDVNSYINIYINGQSHSQDFFPFKESIGLTNCDAINSEMSPPGYFSCHSMQVDDFSSWDGFNKIDYRKKKEIIFDHTVKKLEQHIPDFSKHIDLYEVGTPKTLVRYTQNPQGAIYAFSPTPESFKQRSHYLHKYSGSRDKHIRNLYFASAWSCIPGFSGAISAGHKAAEEIIKDWC